LLYLHFPAFASTAKVVKEGNNLYHQVKYDEAIEKYNKARAESPDSDIVNFNLGAALYKKGRYQQAVEAFSKALNKGNKEMKEKAMYNIANSKYKLGNYQEDTYPSSAVSLYRESLDYYKRAMELDKNDKDAKHNHEFVEKKLKELLEKIKNQSPQKRQNQGWRKRNKQEDRKSQGQHQEKQGDRQRQISENRQAKTEGNNNKQGEKDSESQTRSSGREKSREISSEEARILLDAYRQEEVGNISDRVRHGYYEEVLKDW